MRSLRDERASKQDNSQISHDISSEARPRLFRVVAAIGLLAAVLSSVPLVDSVSAGPADNFSLSKSDNVGGEALIGEQVTYTIQATGDHASAAPLYNLSFRDVLPVGVDFVSASPAPTEVLTDTPAAGETTVIWSNVSDLPASSRSSVQITVDTNPDFAGGTTGSTTVPVGSTITNNAEAAASLDPFAIPDYSLVTGAFTGDFDGSATASQTVSIIPFRVTKSAPGEMLRGVHGAGTAGEIYTVEVENNPDYATNTVTLVDTLHPGLEFLGCDTYYAGDNTTVGEEWTGSGPVATGAGCAPTPISVDTAGDGSTVVTWDLSNLAPGQVATIQYRAGIPLFENRPVSAPPTPAGLGQGRNLDNNTAPSTGEPDRTTNADPELLTAPEPGLDNTATATGTYTPTGSVDSDSDTHVVESEDLIITKSMSGSLTQGSTVVGTLTISTSEYRDFTNLVVRDLLPSALCFSGGFDADTTPGGSDWNTNDCVGAGSVQSTINGTPVNVASVRELPDGGPYGTGRFELVWDSVGARSALADLDADQTLTITYSAVVREFYRGALASLPGEPVLAGDRVTNSAEVSGPDTVSAFRPGLVADPADPDGGIDGDTTSAGIGNALPSLNKRVSAKAGPLTNGSSVTGAVCDTDYATITWSEGDPTPEPGFGPGDIVCFEIGASFPANVDFEGVQIQDILPSGYTYVTGSAARVTSIDTIPGTTLTEAPNVVTFTANGDGNVEATGNEFRWVIAARINDNTDGAANDINANLQKLIFNDNSGLVYQLRDQAAVEWTEPEVRLAKGVSDVNDGPTNPADFDGSLTGGSTRVEVAGGDDVTFRVDVWNQGNTDATSTEVQDVLPNGITCSEVSAISNGGTCSADVITWTGLTVPASTGAGDLVPDDEDSAPITLTYDVAIPDTVDPNNDYINTAGVAFYQGGTNETGLYDYYPAGNIDPANSGSENTDAADDQAFLDTPAPTITKLQRSAIGEAGNDQNASLLGTNDEATIGEIIQYEITATIPDGTTVYNAEIRDVLPAGLSYFSGSGLFAGTVSNLQPVVTGTPALTGGTVVDSGGTITYELPDPYTNAAGSGDDMVTINFYAQVNDTIGNQADPTPTAFANRARFDWDDAIGNDRPDILSSVRTTRVVEPNPVLVKDHTSPVGSLAAPGATVTYRLTATNPTSASNVSIAHDVTIVDTVPVGITPLGTGGVPVSANGQPVPSTGVSPAGSFDGIWSETNRTITWTPADWSPLDGIAPAGTAQFTYQAEVDDPAVSSSSLTNTAALTAYSLDQDLTPTDDPNEGDARVYTDNDADTITVPLATIVKDIEPFNPGDALDDRASALVGEPVDYEVTVTVPAGTAAYDATIFDDLPSRLELDSFGAVTVSGGCEILNPATGLTTGVTLLGGDVETLNPNGGDPSVLAWFVGDIYSNAGCTITVAYTAHVTDLAADGDSVTNEATLTWNDSDQIASDSPPSLPAAFDSPTSPSWTIDSGPASETFVVVEPQLEIDKDVTDVAGGTLVNPTCDTTTGNAGDADGALADGCDVSAGAELRYTVDVRNEGTSPAHDITFVDTVPVGLTPLQTVGGAPATTTGQTITGNSGSTGTWDQTARTITWTAAGPIAVSNSVTVDYDAVVDASNDLQRGEDLTNTADVDTYYGFSTIERGAIVGANPSNDDIPTYGNGTGATRGSLTPDEVTVEMYFPQLSVTKTATTGQDTDDVRLDQPFSWTIVATNTDAVASAFNVDLVDVLPVGWTYDANSARITTPHNGGPIAVEPDSCSADTGSCADAPSLNTETLTWTDVISGSGQPLAPGQTITLTFTATPQAAALVPDQITGESYTGPSNGHTNTVTVTGEDATGSTSCCDPDGAGGTPPVDYTDTDDAEVFIARADIEVDKAITPVEVDADPVNGPYWFGSFVNYTITVDNTGPDDASGVTVSDILDPATLEFDSVVSIDQGTFNDVTNIWDIGAIPNGASRQIVLRTRLVGLGSVTNIAQNAAADQYDSDSTPGNDAPAEDDQDSVTIDVVPTSLGDVVWLDRDGDGTQDVDEPGIPGVEVDITWLDPATGAPQSYTTVTAADGSYGVPLAVGLPADTDITVTIDVANSPNLVGLVPTFDRDGGLDDTSVDQIAVGDQSLPNGALADLAYDFGYVGDQDLGDKVWWDQDDSADASNGVGEEGIPAVTITATWFGWDGLFGTGDDVDYIDVTDVDGNYLMTDVPPGSYRVVVDDSTLPAGLRTQTYDLDGLGSANVAVAAVAPGVDRLDVDFSYRGVGSIGDTVWFDHDGDGVIDAGEPGLGGVTVTLDWDGPDGIAGNSDDEQLTTTTAADGSYLFEQLPTGDFVVTVITATLPGNIAQTFDADGTGTANRSATTLTVVFSTDLDQDFGYRGLGSIGDTVFFDIDGTETDGALDAGDAPIQNVDVTVVWAGVDAVFGTADDFSITDTTDASGNYLATDLPSGDFRVTVDVTDLPAGLTGPTFDDDGIGSPNTSDTTLGGANPDDDLNQDFSYTGETTGLIGDTVWFDANGDGVEDASEVGFSGVTVDLVWFGPDGIEGNGDDVPQTTTTDGIGNYLFDNLPEGNFRVTIDPSSLPAGLAQTFDRDGTASADTSLVTLDGANPSNLDQDFGYTGVGSIGDLVWLDLDDSGTAVADAGEPGLPGVDVDITWTNPQGANVTLTVTTDADGLYLWPTAPHGDFTVTVDTATLPSVMVQTYDIDGLGSADTSSTTLDAVTPDDLDQDFSYRGSGSLGDTVWQDDDADGVIDGGEALLDGVTVTATFVDPGNGVTFTISTVTAGGGLYSFDNLPAGDYTVAVDPASLPAGLAPVFDLDGVTTANTATATLGNGATRTDVDFGYQPQTDLAIDKSHTGDFAIGTEADGVTNTWTIEVTNLGLATAEAPVVITDTLPTGITYLRSVGTDWNCSVTGQDVACTLVDGVGDDRSLAAGGSASLDLVVEVAAAAAPAVVNRATVTTPTVDTDPDNDSDDDTTDVPLSVLTIDKAVDGDVDQGRQATYVLTVTNTGPSPTRGDVVITDPLPTGLSFVSASSDVDSASCTHLDRVVTCTHPAVMTVGATWSVRITTTVTALAGTSITNVGQVSGGNVVNGEDLSSPMVSTMDDTATATVGNPPGILAFTGTDSGRLVLSALALLSLGAGLVILSRRRSAHR